MKKSFILMTMMILMNQGFAQEVPEEVKKEVVELEAEHKEIVVQDLEAAAKDSKHSPATKRHLQSVARFIKSTSKDISVEMKKLDDCVNCEVKPRTKAGILLTNIGRKLGRGSAWLSTTTAKPFVNAASFLTGIFEKKDKNQDTIALYKFFINHSAEFDKLYLEVSTPEEMVSQMLLKMGEIVELKSSIAFREYMASLGIERMKVSAEDLAKLESFKGKELSEEQVLEKAEIVSKLTDILLTEEELASIDMSKVSPAAINANPSYKEIKGIIGDVSAKDLEDAMIGGMSKSISYGNYKAAMPKIHEAALGLAGQILAPKVALGVISKSLAGIYGTPVLLADVGTGISAAICVQGETKEKFKQDKDLSSFCSYVVNRSAYQLMKSRAKGYVAGKNSREKIELKIKERKARREARREERDHRRFVDEMIAERPIH